MSKATFNVGIGLNIKCTFFYFQTLMNARPIRFKMELSLFSHYRHEGHENHRQPKKLLTVKQMFFVSTLGNVWKTV